MSCWLRVFFHACGPFKNFGPKQRGRSSVRTLAGGGRCPHRHLWRDPKGRNNPKAPRPSLGNDPEKKFGEWKLLDIKLEEILFQKKHDNDNICWLSVEVVKNNCGVSLMLHHVSWHHLLVFIHLGTSQAGCFKQTIQGISHFCAVSWFLEIITNQQTVSYS